MPWGVAAAVVSAAGAAYSADQQKKAGKKAGDSQVQAAQIAADEQRRQYDQTRSDMMPFHDAGVSALGRQEAILNGDYSGFMNSPDYQFALDQGTKFMDRSAAARGSLYSSAHSADMMKYGQGLATQNLNNYWSKLAGQAGQGYQASNALGGYGQQAASNIGNYMTNAGNARASSYLTSANANSQLASQLGNSFGQIAGYYGNGGGSSNSWGWGGV